MNINSLILFIWIIGTLITFAMKWNDYKPRCGGTLVCILADCPGICYWGVYVGSPPA